MSALNELVGTLLNQTRARAIRWERAGAGARSFIARRPSGTVLITGPAGGAELSLIDLAMTTPQGKPAITLEIKNTKGQVVDTADWTPVPSVGLTAILPPGARQDLLLLYTAVKEQVTGGSETISALTKEFRQAES